MNTPSQDKASIWDSYWHDSRLHSNVAEIGPAVETALETHWRQFFDEVPNRSAILDLGCGNGAVASVAVQAGRDSGKSFEVHGVDAAAIDPPKFVTKMADVLSAVQFKPRTAMEALPYAAGQFNAVVSQFAVEYGDLNKIAQEIGRVLAPGGLFCSISFAANSPPVVQSASKMRQSQYLINNTKIFDVSIAVIQALHNIENAAENDGRDTKKYLEKFSEEVEKVMQKFQHAESDTIAAVIGSLQQIIIMRKQKDIREQIGTVMVMKKRIAAHATRLEASVRAALGDSALLGFKRKLGDAGLMEVSSTPFTVPEHGTLGWRISGRKPESGKPG
ncbi:MAG: methyltransferase domain-containing protein [Rhodobacteraceae bacterium]|nr:methyltransferase domain-containing protein [Paracoccaceae bacterium]